MTIPKSVRNAMILIGVVLVLIGGVFAGQGAGLIPGSVMSGDSKWLVIGSIMAVIGIILIVVGSVGRRSGQRNS